MHSRQGMSDEDRLVAVASGDRAAFRAVFENFAPRVKSYLMRLGASGAIAEDLAQDAMVQVWRKAGNYDPGRARASTWIFVIARNAWIDKLRREKVELAYQAAADPEPDGQEAPDDAAERTQTQAQIEAAINILSEEQKQVVRLSFFEDKPHSEIAETLAMPLGTVKSRLRLALMKLRAHWERYA
ncbi:MAG: sigma-70 family RNA polymerase sigma factor [Alphaproteobacteria bacterium]|nr:sigma-70 family RNA polymerase sigma factor [Alphaproteobacteria bacterium]